MLLRPNRAFIFFLGFCNLWKLINVYAKFEFEIPIGSPLFLAMFFVIERPPLLKLGNVRARAKAWGEVLRDVILSSKPKRTQRKWPLHKWKTEMFFFVCSALAIPFSRQRCLFVMLCYIHQFEFVSMRQSAAMNSQSAKPSGGITRF